MIIEDELLSVLFYGGGVFCFVCVCRIVGNVELKCGVIMWWMG